MTPAAPGDSVGGEEGKQASRVEKPTATPTVTPRESVEPAAESSVPAAEGTASATVAAAASAAAAAAATAEDVPREACGATQPERQAAAVGEEEGRKSTEGDGRGEVDDADRRAAAAEALAARLQEQLEEMEVRRARNGSDVCHF